MKVHGGSQVLQQKKDEHTYDQEYDDYYSSEEYYDEEDGEASLSHTVTETNPQV